MKILKLPLVSFFVLALLLSTSAALAKVDPFPKTIPLPNGFQPEGIVSGYGTDFYAGSLANGAIYKGDFRSGNGDILVDGQDGNVAVGLAFDERTGYLFVSGGPTGTATVYNTRTITQVGNFQLAAPGSDVFINDVVVTQDAAFFTDSFNARLFKISLDPTGQLPDPTVPVEIPLLGDWDQAPGFSANGIDATPNGDTLIVVNSTLGNLYLVDPLSGESTLIDLGGGSVTNGDGILLDGKTLYVLQNFANQIAVIDLESNLRSGEIVDNKTDSEFKIPATLTEFGSRLYAVNARFDITPTPDTEYDIVQVSKH
jgi:hypothetical protein